jgi:outer membrane protein insertion porin family
MVQATKNNLFGLGYTVQLGTSLSGWRRSVNVGLTDPHFLGTNLSLGVDFSYNNIDPIVDLMRLGGTASSGLFIPPFKQNSFMVSMRIGFPITPRLFFSSSLQYRYDEMGFRADLMGGRSFAKLYEAAVTGNYMATLINNAITYDKRDNNMLPTKGFMVSLNQSIALPLPWQQHYLAHEFNGSLHIPLYKDQWILNFYFKAGAMVNYGDSEIAYAYRYALGYYNMRGFYFAGVGPHIVRDSGNYDSTTNTFTPTSAESVLPLYGLRGKYYWVGSLELTMPTPLPKEYGVKFLAFVDFGACWGYDGQQQAIYQSGSTWIRERIVDSSDIRVAVGGGILWMSPMGPIRLEIATAVQRPQVRGLYIDDTLQVRIHFASMPI